MIASASSNDRNSIRGSVWTSRNGKMMSRLGDDAASGNGRPRGGGSRRGSQTMRPSPGVGVDGGYAGMLMPVNRQTLLILPSIPSYSLNGCRQVGGYSFHELRRVRGCMATGA